MNGWYVAATLYVVLMFVVLLFMAAGKYRDEQVRRRHVDPWLHHHDTRPRRESNKR